MIYDIVIVELVSNESRPSRLSEGFFLCDGIAHTYIANVLRDSHTFLVSECEKFNY